MKRKRHHYSVEIELEFTADEVRILAECSKTHYDGKCQEASRCGFINEMKVIMNLLEPAPTVTRSFSWSDCDLAAKITEGGWHLSSDDGVLVAELHVFFHETMKAISSLQRVANKV